MIQINPTIASLYRTINAIASKPGITTVNFSREKLENDLNTYLTSYVTALIASGGAITLVGDVTGTSISGTATTTVVWTHGYTTYDARYQATSTKGAANGYAGLDSSGYVPLANINPSLLELLNIKVYGMLQ
jgi:hypothetical protein